MLSVDCGLARRAGRNSRRALSPLKRRALSLADVILLPRLRPADKIATSDSGVLAVAAELGIETIELPPSSG